MSLTELSTMKRITILAVALLLDVGTSVAQDIIAQAEEEPRPVKRDGGRTPFWPPFFVGNPLGLPLAASPDAPFAPMSPSVKVYGGVYNAESCSYDAERGVIVTLSRGQNHTFYPDNNDGFASFINHDGSVHTARWLGVQSPGNWRGAMFPKLLLNEPRGSAIANGLLYVADRNGGTIPRQAYNAPAQDPIPFESVIRVFDMRTGWPASEIRSRGPWLHDIAVANDGTIFGTNTGSGDHPSTSATWWVWKRTPDGKEGFLVQGRPLHSPTGIAIDPQGNVVVANQGNDTVLTFSRSSGELLKTERTVQSGNDGLVIMPDGTKYVASRRNGGISRIRPGQAAELIASNLPYPALMCYDPVANQLAIPLSTNNGLALISLDDTPGAEHRWRVDFRANALLIFAGLCAAVALGWLTRGVSDKRRLRRISATTDAPLT